MKVCVLLPCLDDHHVQSNGIAKPLPRSFPDLGAFSDQHDFQNHFISSRNFKGQIDAAVAQSYDFYFNFLGGAFDSGFRSLEASQYFEGLGLPWSGIPSSYLSTNMNGSHMAADHHNCSHNLAVREHITGQHITCTVIQLADDGYLALPPVVYNANHVSMKDWKLLASFEPEAEIELLRKEKGASLVEHIQKASIGAYQTFREENRGTGGANLGCKVHLRIRDHEKEVFVVGVDPQPASFSSTQSDLAITRAFPGGPRALIDVAMANALLRSDHSVETINKLSDQYSGTADTYEAILVGESRVPAMMKLIVEKFDFSGVTFDIACGTGIFARVLKESYGAEDPRHRVFGFDIAPGMLKICEKFGIYESVHLDSMEETLVNVQTYAETVDHVVCFTAIQLLRPEVLSLFLVLAFALTNKSITFTVNEVPERYNDYLESNDHAYMRSANHVKALEDFGVPAGWELVWKQKEFAWKTPQTGDDIYSVIYRYERVDEGTTKDVLFVNGAKM
ncbi:hypothetical protein QBC37DRAFT_376842 [Rhypophila decipiens]|uniref:Methyltransferase domain-containing protein n=1 Tax=Rhypophila decipiens TaxID=261697 RepID=A0AAN6Y1P2_9PEZI|nr:hypothetical protein QBC37DRAFT_376842 [Rhypophila decipiens]